MNDNFSLNLHVMLTTCHIVINLDRARLWESTRESKLLGFNYQTKKNTEYLLSLKY